MKNFRYIFACCCMLSFGHAAAVDLDLELNSDIDFVTVENGQVGEFSLSLTNHGSATNPSSPHITVSTEVFAPAGKSVEIEFTKNDDIAQTCNFASIQQSPLPSGDSVYYVYFGFPEIVTGETITCYGKFEIKFTKGVRAIDWGVEGHAYNEINPGNEAAQQIFSIAQAVPAIGFYALLTLLLATLLLARFRLSRFKPNNLNNEKL